MRRIVAIVLPELACELAGAREQPLAVVVGDAPAPRELPPAHDGGAAPDPIEPTHVLSFVNAAARRYGVRAGQTAAEARALVAGLAIKLVTHDALAAALGAVAEIALAFGPRASIDRGGGGRSADTAFVDLTGCAHLHGGEEAALAELASRVSALGHLVRVAIADGPRLARAAALYATGRETVVPPGEGQRMIAKLPIAALPVDRDTVGWLAKLGLFTVDDLARLPKAAASSRLGDRAKDALELASGKDDAPLRPYEPPSVPREKTSWDEPVHAIEPLLFALRGLLSRLSARLEGRGEAVRSIELSARHDASIAKLRGAEASFGFRVDLPAPLAREADLFRTLKAKLETMRLAAPVRDLEIAALLVVRAPKVQLDLGRDATASPDALPVLLAELSAEIGRDRVGLLEPRAVHRPEARSRLVPITALASRPVQLPLLGTSSADADRDLPTRLLARPWPVARAGAGPALAEGRMIAVDRHLFTIQSVVHHSRLDQVEWWTARPASRDYARVWLSSGQSLTEAWAFVDRDTGETFLHGFYD